MKETESISEEEGSTEEKLMGLETNSLFGIETNGKLLALTGPLVCAFGIWVKESQLEN